MGKLCKSSLAAFFGVTKKNISIFSKYAKSKQLCTAMNLQERNFTLIQENRGEKLLYGTNVGKHQVHGAKGYLVVLKNAMVLFFSLIYKADLRKHKFLFYIFYWLLKSITLTEDATKHFWYERRWLDDLIRKSLIDIRVGKCNWFWCSRWEPYILCIYRPKATPFSYDTKLEVAVSHLSL